MNLRAIVFSHTIFTEMSQLSNLYICSYNFLQALGWPVALFRILSNFVATKSFNRTYASAGELIFALFRILSNFVATISFNRTYASAGELICLLQVLGFLEIIHGAIGIVPSGILFPLLQWSGRTHFLLAIVRRISEVQGLPSVFVTFVAWCLSEVIRYPYYGLSCLGNYPSFITYLRYTAFILFYPIGVFPGEMWLMYKALPFIKDKNLYADLFASLPFSYYTFVKVVLIIYPYLWLNLYLYLFKQRRSKLYPHPEKKNK